MKITCTIALLLQFSVLATGVISTTNPWKDVSLFINPDFSTSVSRAVAAYPNDQILLSAAATYPVAYWVDSIARIPNVTRVLSFAKATQLAQQKKVLVEFIIYDLPNRDCAAHASNGEIQCEDLACANGIARYKAEYIDPIVAIMRQFPEVTIVLLIEPDSLPNLSTNVNMLRCPTASTAYIQGTAYAIQQLATLPNAAIYIDAAHGGWLGWPNNLASAATTFKNVLDLAGGPQLIRGFATNTANYQALGSKSSTNDPCKLIGQYNMAIDEVHYVDLLNNALTAVGITGKGYIIDTSRNGVPTTRTACANWCNIIGSGLGVRPTADTAFTGSTLIDAVHWAKVPGESDGVSDPNAPRYDRSCSSPDSVAGAPQAGQWFASYFRELCKNAQPALVAAAAPSGNYVGYTPGPPFIPRGTQVGDTYDDVDVGAQASNPLSVGAKAGVAVGVILFVALISTLVAVVIIRRRRGLPIIPEVNLQKKYYPASPITPRTVQVVPKMAPPINPKAAPPMAPKPAPPTAPRMAPKPDGPSQQDRSWKQKKSPDGEEHWYNEMTGESSWEPPVWKMRKSPDGKVYYENTNTGQSAWV